MKFSIYTIEQIEIPATRVAEIAQALRDKWGLAAGEAVAAEDILNEARERRLIELPEKFKMDPDEDPLVTAEEIAEFIEEEQG